MIAAGMLKNIGCKTSVAVNGLVGLDELNKNKTEKLISAVHSLKESSGRQKNIFNL